MWGANTRGVLARFGDNNWEKGEDFVKTFYVKKTYVGDGGELERARAGWRVWDLGNGTIMLQKLFNPEWHITSKSFLISSFLIGFLFSPAEEISSLELEFEESLRGKLRQRGDWTGVKWSSQSRKTNFLTLPDLAFGFVHKRSGNEIRGFVLIQDGGDHSHMDFWEYFSTWERTQVFTGICGIWRIVRQIYTSINLGHGFKKANALKVEIPMCFCSVAP